MSLWSPTHVQFTVLRARNLIAKGKGGNNDVFVTIQLGKEKYQTSTIKNALNPEWFEECDLPIPHMHTEIEVSLYHRGVLSDDFLGYSSIPIWEHKITEASKSSWVTLHNKPTAKSGDSKYRGELEVKLTFHCQSRTDAMSHGLKKRSSSIRNLASAFGDKFKLTRSRSFRDNRRDSDGNKLDKSRTLIGRDSNNVPGGQEAPTRRGLPPYPHPHLNPNAQPSVHFSALDINRAPWGIDPNSPDALTRSYSMSAAYIKSMSLDRGKPMNYTTSATTGNGGTNNKANNSNNSNTNHRGSNNFPSHQTPDTGVSQLHSQSMYNLPGTRRSFAEIPLHQPPPPPYDLKQSSKDDSALTSSKDRRAMSEYQINSAFRVPLPSNLSHFEPVPRHDHHGIYESIKERTEPENSASSSSDLESVPMPKPRGKRFGHRNVPVMGSSSRDYSKENSALQMGRNNPSDQHAFNARDSGILDDRSSSQGNSLEGSLTATDNTNNVTNKGRGQFLHGNDGHPGGMDQPPPGSGILYHLDRELALNGSGRSKKKVPAVPSQFYSKENSLGELVVRKRSRGQRDRLRQIRQGNRRYTVQGLDNHPGGLYDDSLSEPSDSSRSEVPEDLLSVFKSMTKEELLRVVIQSKAQMIRKDQYIKDLENYIDDLLVRVMETTPRLLNRPNFPRL